MQLKVDSFISSLDFNPLTARASGALEENILAQRKAKPHFERRDEKTRR
jgi:hypothetical protein